MNREHADVVDLNEYRDRMGRVPLRQRAALLTQEPACVEVVTRPFALWRRPPVLSARQIAHRQQMARHLESTS